MTSQRGSLIPTTAEASSLYKLATDAEKRKLAHLVFLELTFKDGKLAAYKAKPEFEILLNRPSVASAQSGSRSWIRTSDLGVNSALLYR